MISLKSCRVRRFTLIVAVILAAAIGSMASTSVGTDSWYLLLDKSKLNPPSYVFGHSLANFISFNDGFGISCS